MFAAIELNGLQLVDVGEMPIDQRRIGELPQVFTRLEFGRVGRQKQQMHLVGNHQIQAGMPARAIEHEHDLLLWAGADFGSEGRQFGGEQRGTHSRRHLPHRATGAGLGKGDQIAPLVTRLDRRDGALARQHPHPLQDRL